MSLPTRSLYLAVFAMTACLAAEPPAATWHFPWPAKVSPLEVDYSSSVVDGYEIQALGLSGQGIQIGGPINALITVKDGNEDVSLKLSLRYRPDTNAGIYLYRPHNFEPTNSDASFAAFAQKLAQQASRYRAAEVEFKKHDDGQVMIFPERIVNKRSIYYNPDSKEPQGEIPFILGQPFYELRYTYQEQEKKRGGIALFVYLPTYVFCVSLECPEASFEAESKLLKDYLMSLYLEANDQPDDSA